MADAFRPPDAHDALDLVEVRLTALGAAIDWPATPDMAGRVADRLRTHAGAPGRRLDWWSSLRPVRRALLAAAALVLLAAAGAAALSFLLPGLRIVSLPPGTPLPPAATAGGSPATGVGSALGLGTAVDATAARGIVGFEPVLPSDPSLGPPDETYVALRRLSHVWHAGPALPSAEASGVGLVVTQFEGLVDGGWYEKLVEAGGTTFEEVEVGGDRAWWISGDPHQLVYRDADGRFLEETRRVVGDVLIWQRDGITIRIESALGREATIGLAETFAPGA